MDEDRRSRGFLPVGSLIATSLGSEDGVTSASTSKPRHSAITTSKTTAFLPTGERLGERGSGALRSSRRATVPATVRQTGDLHRNPARLLPPCVRSSIAATWDDERGKYGWDGRVERYELTRPVPENDRQAALAQVEETLRPIDERAVIVELGRLRSLTVSRDVGQDLTLVFAAYADELRRYPPDAVREVLRDWPRHNRFWPAVAELIERIKPLVEPRQSLREALMRGYRAPELSPDWVPPPSEEDKRAVAVLLERHGYAIDHTGRVRPPETEPMTPADRQRIAAETASFRLPDESDPRVQARLREMGIAPVEDTFAHATP